MDLRDNECMHSYVSNHLKQSYLIIIYHYSFKCDKHNLYGRILLFLEIIAIYKLLMFYFSFLQQKPIWRLKNKGCITTSYPFICRWESRLLPCSSYCKQCCNEQWNTCVFFNLKEKDKYPILMHVYRIQKNSSEEFIYRAAMEKQTQRIDLWTWGEGRRG